MSYSIYIGEASLTSYGEPDEPGPFVARVEEERLSDAPRFPGDTMTGNSNGRHPGYSQWDKFCSDVGLHDLFFARDYGLLSSHPGCMKLLPAHLGVVRDALARWRAKRPTMVPGWCECSDCAGYMNPDSKEPHHPERDGHLARLMWLEWWMDKALSVCLHPAMSNT